MHAVKKPPAEPINSVRLPIGSRLSAPGGRDIDRLNLVLINRFVPIDKPMHSRPCAQNFQQRPRRLVPVSTGCSTESCV